MRFTRSGSNIIEMNRIKFENYSKYYSKGLRLHTSKIKRTPETCVDQEENFSKLCKFVISARRNLET